MSDRTFEKTSLAAQAGVQLQGKEMDELLVKRDLMQRPVQASADASAFLSVHKALVSAAIRRNGVALNDLREIRDPYLPQQPMGKESNPMTTATYAELARQQIELLHQSNEWRAIGVRWLAGEHAFAEGAFMGKAAPSDARAVRCRCGGRGHHGEACCVLG
jgi:hypothetical protein